MPFPPPSIQGLGHFGGFQFEVLDQTGGDINALAAATFGMVGAGNASPVLTGLFSAFTANDPQLVVEIDREQAKALGCRSARSPSALQIFIGSQYVNDFDFNNRAYRVYVQADQQFRAEPAALGKLYVRTQTGQMVPLEQRGRASRRRRRRRSSTTSTCSARRNQRLGGAGLQLGPGAAGDGARRDSRRCRRA